MVEQWVEDPALRQRHRFSRSTDPDGGEVLHVETWIEPGGGVPPHVHPAMEERFHVLEGRASFLAGRTWLEAGPGEVVVVPPGTRHAYRNRSDAPAHIRCDVRPPSSLQEFLEEVAELATPRPCDARRDRQADRAAAGGGDRPAPPRHGHAAVPADAAGLAAAAASSRRSPRSGGAAAY